MKSAEKAVMIQAIIFAAGEIIKNKNLKFASENMHSDQVKFDATDLWLKLAFMPDSELENIARHTLT